MIPRGFVYYDKAIKKGYKRGMYGLDGVPGVDMTKVAIMKPNHRE